MWERESKNTLCRWSFTPNPKKRTFGGSSQNHSKNNFSGNSKETRLIIHSKNLCYYELLVTQCCWSLRVNNSLFFFSSVSTEYGTAVSTDGTFHGRACPKRSAQQGVETSDCRTRPPVACVRYRERKDEKKRWLGSLPETRTKTNMTSTSFPMMNKTLKNREKQRKDKAGKKYRGKHWIT